MKKQLILFLALVVISVLCVSIAFATESTGGDNIGSGEYSSGWTETTSGGSSSGGGYSSGGQLNSVADAEIARCKDAYNTAKAAGDTAGMAAAHNKAELVRQSNGYTGGVDGSSLTRTGTGTPATTSLVDQYLAINNMPDTPINRNAASQQIGGYVSRNEATNGEMVEAGITYKETPTGSGNWQMISQDEGSKTLSGEDLTIIGEARKDYETAQAAYYVAIANGDTAAATAAQASMASAHAAADAVRAANGYSAGDDGAYLKDATTGGYTGSYNPAPVSPTYSITATATGKGTISPAGTTYYNAGDTATFSFSPTTDYKVKTLKIDGVTVSAANSYAFPNISANHTVEVEFGYDLQGTIDSFIVEGADKNMQMKSGYGLGIKVKATTHGKVTFWCVINGYGQYCPCINGTYVLPESDKSATHARKVYIPVKTKNGTRIPVIVKMTVSNPDDPDDFIVVEKKAFVTINGNMYDDDFTGDR